MVQRSRPDDVPTGTRFLRTPDMSLSPDIRSSAFSRWALRNRSHRHHVGGRAPTTDGSMTPVRT